MADWRGLVSQHLQQDSAVRRSNPGLAGLKQLVQTAIAGKMQEKQDVRREGAGARNAARSAVYSRYPGAAAEELGIDVGDTTTGTPTAPAGTELGKVTYDEGGRPTYQFEAPDKVDAPFLVKLYNTYTTETQKANANALRPEQQTEIKPMRDWLRANFPQYLSTMYGEEEGGDDLYYEKPADVPADAWDAATPEQRKELLDSRG